MIQLTSHAWTPLAAPALDWRDDVPVSRATGDIYFSSEDGLAESQYVFVEGNQLPTRWASLPADARFTLAEIGVGTALNLCLTIARWLEQRPAGATLHYIGFEHAPMDIASMRRALSHWPTLNPIVDRVLARWPDPLPGCQRRRFSDWGITVDLWWGDAGDALNDLASHQRAWVDAWYLDGFAPAREPGPWRDDIFTAMAALSRTHATFATFTAAGEVKRALGRAGFAVNKRPGFGSKREALQGSLAEARPATPQLTPWDLNPEPLTCETAVVVGAGLAGSHVAATLAARGISVTVLEAGVVAGEGSGNLQGVTYTRLSHQHNPLTDFSVAAFSAATDCYQQLLLAGALCAGKDMGTGGYIQLHDEDATLQHLKTVLPLAPDFATVLTANEVQHLTGQRPRAGGIHYRRGGWLDPRAVCRALLTHPLITVREHCGAVTVSTQPDGHWQAQNAVGEALATGPLMILATAQQVGRHPGLEWLPLATIRGQTTHLDSPASLAGLSVALCDQGYLPPARDGVHCLGASFVPDDDALDERSCEHAHNIDMMSHALPDLALTPPDGGWRGHVARRCNSNDYLPVVGTAPDLALFNQRYDRLRHDRKRVIAALAPVQTGLALLTSLGSRGLSAAPLAAEMLADHVFAAPPCTPRYLQRAVSPARFAERALKRGTPL